MSKPKVLYVEDEIFLAKIVSETLQGRGFEVILESDGAKVIPKFESIQPDVCILDIMLPNKDGFAIADAIREKNANVPIIFLTAKSEVGDVVNGFRLGGNDYIRKPFSMEELIVRIENVLKKTTFTGEVLAEEVLIGRLTFNTKRQVLSMDGEDRKLSYRESELLKLLYENRDKIVERKEILNLLWGSDSFFNSRNLDVYITKIRNYLRADPRWKFLPSKELAIGLL
jgi:DNA-binding response OmpR family regulator